MNQKRNVADEQPAATLSESQLASRKAIRKIAAMLARSGATNLTVYEGRWANLGGRGRTILRDQRRLDPLCAHKTAHGLLAWLKARIDQPQETPVVIIAKRSISPAGKEEKPRDYLAWFTRAQSDTEWALQFGPSWPRLKRLAAIAKRRRTESSKVLDDELRTLLADHPETVETARQLGLPVTSLVPSSDKTAQGVESKPATRLERGKRCAQIVEEVKRFKYLRLDFGKTVTEIQEEQPNLFIWRLRENLNTDDRKLFDHPNQWGSVATYAYGLLGKEYGKSWTTIRDWVKSYRRDERTMPH